MSAFNKKQVRRWTGNLCLRPYPFQIPTYHLLTVNICQSPGNVFELPGANSSVTGTVNRRNKPYKLEPIRTLMRLDIFIDSSISHPFGHHRKTATVRCHSQQLEHIRMAEPFPQYDLSAEHLRSYRQLLRCTFGKLLVVTHFGDLSKVSRRVRSRNLDCNLAILIFAHPHISESTTVRWKFRSVIAKRDFPQ